MSIQIPKNVRLCGRSAETHNMAESVTEHIYLEDYVVTFLRQVKDRYGDRQLQIDLYGRKQKEAGQTWYFVYGAGMAGDDGCFSDHEYLGQAHYRMGKDPEDYLSDIQRGNNALHVILTDEDGDIILFYKEDGYVRRTNDYFVFYEKNEAMQNFLVEWYRRNEQKNERKKEPEVTDQAAQNFRRLYQERQQERQQNKLLSMMYAASLMLLILCCITGISMINQFDKMREMGQAIDHLTLAMEERRLPERTYVVQADALEDMEEENAKPEKDVYADAGQNELSGSGGAGDELVAPAMSQSVTAVLPETQADVSDENAIQISDEISGIEKAEPENQYYIVKEGDTLAGISRTLFGTSSRLADICELNDIENPNNIIVGQKLLLPND